MNKYFKSDAAEAEGADDGAGDATDPSAANDIDHGATDSSATDPSATDPRATGPGAANDSDDLCTLLPLPLSKLSLSKDDDPEDLSLLQYFRVKCYAVLIFLSPFCFVHFADNKLENVNNDVV